MPFLVRSAPCITLNELSGGHVKHVWTGVILIKLLHVLGVWRPATLNQRGQLTACVFDLFLN